MRVRDISKMLNEEVETDVALFSAIFELQKLESYERVSEDVYAAHNGNKTFLLADFEGDLTLVDVIPRGDVKINMIKQDSIKKLLEVKRGMVVPFEESLAGSAFPARP